MTSGSSQILVLHVDDDPDFAELTADFLEQQDDRIAVETADNTSDAIEALAASSFDCIVSDYEMPGQNGIEFLETIREDHPELPFILYTGKGSEEIASDAISAGVTDYLQKGSGTSQYEVLTNRIQNAVEQRRALEEAAETEERLQTIAEHTNDILWKFTADWDELLFINSPYEEIWGQSIDELKKQPRSFLKGVHPDDRPDVEAAMEQLSAGESVDLEYRVNAEEDYGRWVWVQGEPVFDIAGEVEKVVGFARDVTERKMREQELEAARSDYEALFEASPVPIWVQGLREIYYANEAAAQFHGVSDPVELTGRSAMEFVPDGEVDQTLRRNRRMLDEGEPLNENQATMVADDGEERQAIFSAAPITYRGEDALVAFALDISERRKRERELQQERDRVEALFENSVDAIAYTEFDDGEPIVKDVNPAFEETFGCDRESAIGRPIDEIVVPEDPEKQQEANELNRRIESGERIVTEVRRRTTDGTQDFLLQSTPITPGEESGDTYAIYKDISERKEREQELEAAQELTHALSTTFPDYTFIYNAEGEYLDVITGWEGDTDLYTKEELIGRNIEEMLSNETATRIQSAIQRTLDTGGLQSIEYAIQAASPTRWYEANLAPLEAGYGGEQAVVLTARNITERKEREEELQRQNERLEEFASVVSHDLRNPLTVAEGHLQLAIQDRDWEELEAVTDAHDRMKTLIDDMLSLAIAGEAVGDPQTIELSEVANACWRNVETESATFQVETQATIQADKTRLQQLLENLLRNSIEYGGADVTITIGDLDNGFYIEDDGPGIPPDERETVLEPGYSTREDGTGFGLSIVRDIVEAHGWDIAVTKGSDDGARIEITDVELVTD